MNIAPYTVNYKRAGDLFPPPLSNQSSIENWNLKEKNVSQLADWLDSEKFTGVLKASSNKEKFRGALLLFAGWCIGAVYSSLEEEPYKHTHLALPALLSKLENELASKIEIYTLPEKIVLPFSSAFIGQFMVPIENADPMQTAKYFYDHIHNLPRHSLITMKVSSYSNSELCLVFFYLGKISGHFLVDQQKFLEDGSFPDYILAFASEAIIHLSILSPEIDGVYSGSTRFGFPLKTI